MLLAAVMLAAATAACAGDLLADLREAMAGKAAPGAAVVIIRDGKVVEEAHFGVRRLGGAPVGAQERWHLGSDGKAMTATMIARLVERKKLSWTARLDEMLPELAATMRPEYRDITLLDLLSHRAGLPENHDDMTWFATFFQDRRPLPVQRLAYVTTALKDAPIGKPRGTPSYSNTGFLIAAVIAERATGRSFESLMREEVFRPLGMSSATFDEPGPAETAGHVDGHIATLTDSNPAMFVPAGGERMTLKDWARFCIDQMQGEAGGGKLLKPETYRLLHTGQGGTRNALGWGSAATIAGRKGPVLTHAGSDGNWYALVALFPESRNGVLVATNAAESMGGDKAATALIKAELPKLAPPAP